MRLTTILLVVLIAGACSPVRSLGSFVGGKLGAAVASVVPVPTNTKVDPRGGKFCDVMSALGWPPKITDDKMNRPLANAVVGTLEHGEKQCQWKP